MALVEINGLEIPTFRDTLVEDAVYLGDNGSRGATGRLFDNRIARKRRWTFETRIRRWEDAERLKDWIEGRGHAWLFDSNKYSSTAIGNRTAGTFTVGASGAKHGFCVSLDSSFAVELRNKMGVARLGLASTSGIGLGSGGWDPTQGWTMAFWAYLTAADDGVSSDDWHHFLAHGAVVVDGSSPNPVGVAQFRDGVAGSWSFGNIATVRVGSSPYTSLRARTTAGVAAAGRKYDDLVVLPYEIDASWVPSIYAFADAYEAPMLPFVFLGGDVINGGTPIRVRGRCDTAKYRVARAEGATEVEANNRSVSVLLEEW